ncbi:sugar kinase [Streptomyces olivaceus]|uniref:sugar kinase n=1 Tax=Streptomyces olivaceus TaxID=47716 RepID=UPI0022EE230D|nr:sugar kinase [Streptomyces olivaceus]GHI94553.1 carbohydrate kinase [Streptomyces olivaceus]
MPSAPPSPAADVVCVGETMAVLGPSDDRPLAEQESVRLGTGGAESNVACALAGLGHRAAWLSRLGDDPFGRRIRAELAARGVDVDAVQTDPDRPTGVYFKDPGRAGTRTHYYRRGSAAAGMGPELARLPLLRRARLVHLSGITAALSESCGLLLDALLLDRHPGAEGGAAGPVVSFDVNHRPALWRDGPARAADRLLALARAADLVFVGRDEAEALWGTKHADDAAALLAPAPVVVVKDAEYGATAYVRGTRTFVPSLPTKVVEPVGAGDAFAAGYLSGFLDGRDERARLRLGHLAAGAALRTVDDVPVMPAREENGRFLTLDDAAWAVLPPR